MNVFAYAGVYGGALCGLLGWWLGRYFARKNRGLDELYELIWQKARARSWIVTLFAIYVFFTLTLSGVQMSAMLILSLLLFVHMISWALLGVYYNFKLRGVGETEDAETTQASRTKVAIGIGVAVLVLFVILSLVTNNWKFFWFSLPAVFGSTMTTVFAGKQKRG